MLAREGDEHLVLAVGTAHAGKPLLQITALEKGGHGLLDDRPPETLLGLIAFVVDLLKEVPVFSEQTPQVGGLGIAWAVERSGLDTGGGHGRERVVNACTCIYMRTHERLLSSPHLGLTQMGTKYRNRSRGKLTTNFEPHVLKRICSL